MLLAALYCNLQELTTVIKAGAACTVTYKCNSNAVVVAGCLQGCYPWAAKTAESGTRVVTSTNFQDCLAEFAWKRHASDIQSTHASTLDWTHPKLVSLHHNSP